MAMVKIQLSIFLPKIVLIILGLLKGDGLEAQSGEVSVDLVLKAGKGGEELVARRRRARLIVRQVGSRGFVGGTIDADVR